jgi:hypothetical protein
MDIISDDKQVNQLITAYKELKDTGINKLIVNYEWNSYSNNSLKKKEVDRRQFWICGKRQKYIKQLDSYDENEVAQFV